jgi:hypothetical protein
MLDARLNVVRVEQRHAELSRAADELSRAAVCRRSAGAEHDAGRCAVPVPARGLRLRSRRRASLRFVAALWRG